MDDGSKRLRSCRDVLSSVKNREGGNGTDKDHAWPGLYNEAKVLFVLPSRRKGRRGGWAFAFGGLTQP